VKNAAAGETGHFSAGCPFVHFYSDL